MIYDNDNNHMQVALPVVSYCETWTYSIAHKVNAFEMWCYRECRELVRLLIPQTLMYYRKWV